MASMGELHHLSSMSNITTKFVEVSTRLLRLESISLAGTVGDAAPPKSFRQLADRASGLAIAELADADGVGILGDQQFETFSSDQIYVVIGCAIEANVRTACLLRDYRKLRWLITATTAQPDIGCLSSEVASEVPE